VGRRNIDHSGQAFDRAASQALGCPANASDWPTFRDLSGISSGNHKAEMNVVISSFAAILVDAQQSSLLMKRIDVYQEILHWSTERPPWQKDALRRIVVNGSLNNSDLVDLDYLCCVAHDAVEETTGPLSASEANVDGVAFAPQPVVDPLASHHLPTELSHAQSVSIVRLEKLSNVNRLSSSNKIDFGPAPGLTVIYGDNGSGKSGYARVIRKACRTRGNSTPIQPNVFMNAVPSPASADFTLAVNGKEIPVKWKDGLPSDPNLGRILFFDALCAESYVQEDGVTTFSPAGLDILTKLTRACDSIKEQIAKRMRETQGLIDASKQAWSLHEGTKVSTFINSLNAASDESRLQTLTQWDTKASQRLDAVHLLLASNPLQKAAETRASIARVKAFREKLNAQLTALNDVALTALQQSYSDCHTAELAHQISSQSTFDSNFLPGTGGMVWRLLWEAARKYSTLEAYPDEFFPNIEVGTLCVLCQTPLDNAASQRLARFELFVKDLTLKTAEQKRSELDTFKTGLENLPDLTTEFTTVETDLLCLDHSIKLAISECIADSLPRRDSLLHFISTGDADGIAKAPENPVQEITQFEERIEEQAKTEESLHDANARASMLREANELEDRLWLYNNGTAVAEQIGRLKKLARLTAAQADTNTTQVTSKATWLNKAIVNESLCDTFKNEIDGMGLHTIKVGLCPAGGQKGTLRFGVRLAGVDSNVVSKVASEGEKRCIAFALFMAELSQASDTSALVLDDPASSLDHLICEQMAKRISREALKRQVIVFTHNPVFLHDLQTGADESKAARYLGYLQWNGDTPGEWNTGLPWEWKSVKDRFDHLRKEQLQLAKTVSTQMTEDDKQGIRRAYIRLRGTLERIIETKIFGGAVLRFSNYVNVKFVVRAVGFAQSEFDELKRLYDRCSDISDAHDASSGLHKTVPDPQKLKEDIESTEKLVETITARQETNKMAANP
jgi:ABC-type transport system involved in cytochrome c biogenesis ATPase subunit